MQTKREERIGIYGGTFSPPHNGHVHAAKCFFDFIKPDKLVIIPTGIPPHKARTEKTSAENRLSMCRMAFDFSDNIIVSDMEIKREGKSYTSDTLTFLRKEGRRLFFLCGTDMLLTLDCWHEPETIFRLAEIVYIAREDEANTITMLRDKAKLYREKYGATVHELSAPPCPMSSSAVRDAIANGKPWEDTVPRAVAEFIHEKGLYQ